MRRGASPAARVASRLELYELAAAAGSLDALARAGAECVRVHGQRLVELALGQDLDGHVLATDDSVGLHQLERDLAAGLEAIKRGDVHGLGVRAERLERHRLLHVWPAQLSHAHVDRHLAALEVGPPLGARARARALLAAARG